MPVTRPQAAEAASGANRHGATGTEPASSLPSHALALADVVGALENADIPRLRAALSLRSGRSTGREQREIDKDQIKIFIGQLKYSIKILGNLSKLS